MNTKIVILIPFVVATASVFFFLNIRPEPGDGREFAQPVLTLKKADKTIEIFVSGELQYFTVKNDSGEILAEMLNLDELTAQLPDTAEEIGRGLADISAENSAGQTPVPSGPAAQAGNIGIDLNFQERKIEGVSKHSLIPLPVIRKEPIEGNGVPSQ